MTALLDDSPNSLRIHPFCVLWAAMFLCLQGCGDGDYSEYVEPPDANAQLVVHPDGDNTYDVFLDGDRLGRISWTQAYRIPAGQHVFGVSLASRITSLSKTIEHVFEISPGETLHLAVVRWGEYGPGPTPGSEQLIASGLRISEIHP